MPTSRFHRRRRRRQSEWAAGSWGGHAVYVGDFSGQRLACRTWGQKVEIDWEFFNEYCDEAYVAISLDWLGTDDKSPHGFASAELFRDLAAITH